MGNGVLYVVVAMGVRGGVLLLLCGARQHHAQQEQHASTSKYFEVATVQYDEMYINLFSTQLNNNDYCNLSAGGGRWYSSRQSLARSSSSRSEYVCSGTRVTYYTRQY